MSQKYSNQQAEMARRARAVKALVKDPEKPFFENVEGIENIASVWRSALVDHIKKNGSMPSNSLLANAHAALERQIQKHTAMLESTTPMFISGGVMKVPVWSMFILPVLLQSTTQAMCTFVNASHDIVDVLSLIPVAADNRGDYSAGERLDGTNMGRLSAMRRYVNLKTADLPDGKKTSFTFDIKHELAIPPAIPVAIRAGTLRLIASGGSFPIDIDNEINRDLQLTIGGLGSTRATIDYVNGEVKIDFDTAAQFQPLYKTGATLILECDIDEEFAPLVVGSMTMQQRLQRVRQTHYLMNTEFTIQALTDLQREQNLDMTDLMVSEITKFIASEQDARRLRAALAHVVRTASIDCGNQSGMDLEEWVFNIKKAILSESDKLKAANYNLGITAAYCGEQASRLFRSLPIDYFDADPAFQLSTGLCRAGRLFGLIDIYAVDDASVKVLAKSFPNFKTNSVLFVCSDGAGHSPLVAGDGIPPTQIDHAVSPILTKQVTVFGTEINAVNPFQGPDFMTLAELTNLKP